MGLFSRKRPRPSPLFPQLDDNRAEQLSREISEGFDARGFDSTITGDSVDLVRRETGEELSLDVSKLVAAVARDDSPHAVAAWTQNYIKAAVAIQSAVNPDTRKLYEAVRLVLVGHEGGEVDSSVLYEVVDGLAASLVFDSGEAILPVAVESVTRIDDLATIERAARGNLAAELRGLRIESGYQGVDGSAAGCWVQRSDGPYLSAAPLLMEDFLLRHLPQLPREHGVLFSVPLPNFLLLGEVTQGERLSDTLHMLAAGSLGFIEHSGAPEALSPRVYHWYEGRIEAVSSVTEEGFLIEPSRFLLDRQEG
ncbi:hypothetical protein [Corynebacterium doosanense]|uniref:Uncharacterized protein n=1 Tax=Corynebacterium doosanense CAU 212 = DSM 45436 TaxID=558173 RepID=A0A097IJC1_9CORY|nr:hypothetical protein [Corynebacterium doosanense]AIT62247.1 hypothetical protein CDOO_04890 [Corynebacterium doosanense CAU 212 = DSM 45436]